MTDRTQFEQMLEALINEDQQTAKDIFHNIVVAKSREIYEELLESEFKPEQPGADEDVMDEEEEKDEFSDKDDTDDQIDDVEADDDSADDFGGEEEEGDVEDRVQDLEDALEDLKAEFEQLMANDEGGDMDDMGGDDMGGDDMGMDDEPEFGADDMGSMDDEIQPEGVPTAGTQVVKVQHSFMEDDEQLIREYVEKVASPKMGDNGANTRSIVAGKNNMGGTTANIVAGHVEVSSDIGAKTTVQGSALSSNKAQDMKTGNINVPGGNAGKSSFKKREPGHGAEKKGAAETADKSAGSTLNGVKSRAK